MVRRRIRPFPLALAVAFALSTSGSRARAQGSDSTTAQAGKSVWQGVYTETQAARGDTEHQTNCLACHGTEKYTGEAFTQSWVGRTVFDLVDYLRTTMPDDAPGSLALQQYVDVVAFIFRSNGMPASPTDSLTVDLEPLRLIRIDAKPDSQPSLAARRAGVGRSATLVGPRLTPMYHPHRPVSPTAAR